VGQFTVMPIESEISRDSNLHKILKNIANTKTRKISFSYQMHFWYRRLRSLNQGSGAGTKISGSRHLKCFAPALVPMPSEISDLLLFVSYFASQNEEIKFGNYFFDVCCAN